MSEPIWHYNGFSPMQDIQGSLILLIITVKMEWLSDLAIRTKRNLKRQSPIQVKKTGIIF